MVVAIYYFLHQAGIRMKIFAFTIYTCGMLAYLGMMLIESGVLIGAQKTLRAIPVAEQDLSTQFFLGLRSSWSGPLLQSYLTSFIGFSGSARAISSFSGGSHLRSSRCMIENAPAGLATSLLSYSFYSLGSSSRTPPVAQLVGFVNKTAFSTVRPTRSDIARGVFRPSSFFVSSRTA